MAAQGERENSSWSSIGALNKSKVGSFGCVSWNEHCIWTSMWLTELRLPLCAWDSPYMAHKHNKRSRFSLNGEEKFSFSPITLSRICARWVAHLHKWISYLHRKTFFFWYELTKILSWCHLLQSRDEENVSRIFELEFPWVRFGEISLEAKGGEVAQKQSRWCDLFFYLLSGDFAKPWNLQAAPQSYANPHNLQAKVEFLWSMKRTNRSAADHVSELKHEQNSIYLEPM
jgi:hypothetical protein